MELLPEGGGAESDQQACLTLPSHEQGLSTPQQTREKEKRASFDVGKQATIHGKI